MGILDSIFGGKLKNENNSFWVSIQSLEDLENAIQASNQQKIAIFKHSTRCGISARVKANFEKEIANQQLEVIFYYLDLLKHRDISNKIAADFEVVHQSPQLIVMENGVVTNHASHNLISLELLK
jgi:bacillithiol system protein YtxJ